MTELETFIEAVRRKHHLPALAVGVCRTGKPDVVAACGVRKDSDPAPVTTDDPFHLGSCSKAVTAALIHKLVGESKLKLSDTLADIFPSLNIHAGYRDVTVAEVLTHSAGLPRDGGMLTDPPAHGRGTYAYSNLGYVLLGQIIQQTTGMPFEQYARQEIFDPLGMKSAGYGLPDAASASPPAAPWGHRRDEQTQAPIVDNTDYPAAYVPAGGIHANVSDWLKFLKFEMEQKRLERPYHTALMGNGNFYTDSGVVQVGDMYCHDGSNERNYTRQTLYPKQGTAFFIATNDGSKEAEKALGEVSRYLKKHYLAPEVAAEQGFKGRVGSGNGEGDGLPGMG